mmetsp:Transcript_23245/g.34321  ORF Transcript_23245/g.34321 Transcript_23245/m.34321 type:complete len:94 (+) Transcript_23245:147-428(+)
MRSFTLLFPRNPHLTRATRDWDKEWCVESSQNSLSTWLIDPRSSSSKKLNIRIRSSYGALINAFEQELCAGCEDDLCPSRDLFVVCAKKGVAS